jgi:hypothetical protein
MLGHHKGAKVNERKVVKGKEVLSFTKGGNLGELMDIAHGVTPLGLYFEQEESRSSHQAQEHHA